MNKPLIEASCVVDDVEYHAETKPDGKCQGCAGYTNALCPELGECMSDDRADRSTIIWVKA